LKERKNEEAINYFRKALQSGDGDEMIFYNFAAALYNDGQYQKADSALKKGLEINPDSEIILMYLGNIYKAQNKKDEAVNYYEKVIGINRKYFEAYVNLAELIADSDVMKARSLLRQCVRMNPNFTQAYKALGDTYKDSHPDIAKKYYDKANRIN
jgi:tetratricopeptide (TPR) repeat protein